MNAGDADILETAAHWIGEGRRVALGTVVKTWGSAPRQAGNQIAVCEDGAFVGSVSGGCVESAVIEEAQAAMADGKVRRLEFGVGLACGGHLEICVEPRAGEKAAAALAALNQARYEGRAVVRAVDLSSGEERLVDPKRDTSPLGLAAAAAVQTDQSARVEIEGQPWFLGVFNPPLDLAIVGAVHVAQPLAQLASIVGYSVRVIDPRMPFATAERFPGITLSHEWPDEALARLPLGRRSALIVLAHDPKLDDPALAAALASPAFYIGALGSKRTHAARLARLKNHGFTDDVLARIHGPVGLAIGAKSPAEIAISILAQMTGQLRARPQDSQPRGSA
jgi:xanthine dehydrogenase accessory factor